MDHKYVYEVTVKARAEAAFAGLSLGEGGYTEPVDTNEDGTEVYAIYTNRDIDAWLDQNDQVVCYTVADGYGNYY